MKAPIIESEHHILRPFTVLDAGLWQTWDTDPDVQAFMPEPRNEPQNLEEHYQYVQACADDPEGYYWSIETRDSVTIGTVSLTGYNKHHSIASLGIVIGNKEYWGRSVSTEVITTLVQYSFTKLNLHYIDAEVEEGNTPMMKSLEKVGFKKDGIFESARVKNGVRINVHHFSIHKQ